MIVKECLVTPVTIMRALHGKSNLPWHSLTHLRCTCVRAMHYGFMCLMEDYHNVQTVVHLAHTHACRHTHLKTLFGSHIFSRSLQFLNNQELFLLKKQQQTGDHRVDLDASFIQEVTVQDSQSYSHQTYKQVKPK